MTALHGEALALLTAWLPPNEQTERPQIQLASVDADGLPDARTVLLSEWSPDGFVFHTDSRSRKVHQLDANPAVALVVLWPAFTRQLIVRGTAEPAGPQLLERAYSTRSPYLKQLAWQNSPSTALLPRAERVAAWREFAEQRDPADLSAPPTWTGYLVRPDRLTFWQSDPQGPSHRVEHRRGEGGAWTAHHLAG